MQIVVLAGGLGTRMRSVSELVPKVMLPVVTGGREIPFIHHQLNWLVKHGATEIVLSIGHKGQMIRDLVGSGAQFGVRVQYVDEGEKLRGTAGALRFAYDEGVLSEKFMLIYGDSFLPIDLQPVWAEFERVGEPALMTIYRNGGKFDRSNARWDGSRVFYDKSADPVVERMDFIDYGLSVFKRDVIRDLVAANIKYDLADVMKKLSLDGHLAGFEVRERFYEIGSPVGLKDFQDYINRGGAL